MRLAKHLPWLVLILTLIGFSSPDMVRGQSGENDLVTNVPGTFASGTSVSSLIGANRFYNAGFTGQGTITANVEAGHIWNGHESLAHVASYANDAAAWGTTTADLYDRHATWVGQMIGGRSTAVGGGAWQTGIAPGTDLRSGAITSGWAGSAYALSFNFDPNSFVGGYSPYFGTADVINSSWGGNSPAGNNAYAVVLDGFAAQNSQTTFVVSAGNSGPGTNTVGFPGSGYNAITVAALNNGGNNSYDAVANFSSRGPMDFFDPIQNKVISGVRAAVDIAAPGTNLTGAYYGGQTGGNNTSLSGSSNNGAAANTYSTSLAGTSFASPIVAGATALVKSASYNTPALAGNAASRNTLVVKSVLMNSADKITGWSNGQVANSNGYGGVTTTQSLDWASGAGKLNLDRAFDQYLTGGTRDVLGLANGNLGVVSARGWDLGNVLLGGTNLYTIGGLLEANTLFNVTLNWFRNRTFDPITTNITDDGQADLTLRVIDILNHHVISESKSLYNTAELLSFLLPTTSQYGIEVYYGANTYGSLTNVNYGLAWSASAPEPGTLTLGAVSLLLAGAYARRRRKSA
jgi:subtilisin family serine protease